MIVLQRKGLRALALNLGIFGLLAGESLVCAAEQREGRENTARQALPIDFDIPAQPLDTAVQTLAQQAGVQVLFDRQLLQGLRSTELKQTLGLEAALQHLLGGNAVRYRFTDAQQLTLTPLPASNGAVELELTDITGIAYQPDDWVYQAPRSVSLISREQIDKRPPRHAADMLEETPGVYTAVNQRDPGLSVNIRGVQDYGRVNMNIDGMRQNFNVNGHQQRNGTMLVDPEMLSGVQIDKGSQSGMGGAGVLGGIATFRTWEASDFLTADKEYGGRLRAGHGLGAMGNGTYFNGSGVVAVGNEVGDLLVGVSERHFGNYTAGQNNDRNLGMQVRHIFRYKSTYDDWLGSELGQSGSTTRSQIFKAGINLPEDQRLQVNFLHSDSDSKNAWAYTGDKNEFAGYLLTSRDDMAVDNFAVEYSLNPDNDWINLKSKVYFVSSTLDRWTAPNGRSLDSGNFVDAFSSRYQTNTWGLQVENNSSFQVGAVSRIGWTQGMEVFRDSFDSSTTRRPAKSERTLPYVEGATPEGTRTIASIFNKVSYNHEDWLSLNAGLRYDQARLQGQTGMSVWAAQIGTNKKKTVTHVYDIDRTEGSFLPSVGLSIKPGPDWLELFAHWGKGARPPAVTEMFMTGPAHAGGSATVYPNPFLKTERSQDWELGVNLMGESLITADDSLRVKVAYFDTRVRDFTFARVTTYLPGATFGGLGEVSYMNAQNEVKYRGLEYNLKYDAGFAYADINYTKMIGSNKFCGKVYPMGGAVEKKDGVYVASPEGDRQVECGGIFGSSTFMPADKGSVTLGGRFIEKKLDVGVRYRFSRGNGADLDSKNYEFLNQAMWPVYNVYDLYANMALTKNLGVTVALENATDESYVVAMGDFENISLAKGRTLTGMLQYSF